MHTAIVNCIVCDAVKLNHISAKKEYRLINRKVGEVGMSATEKVVNDLNISKLMLCNPQMLTQEMCVRIGQAINGAIDLLKEQEPKQIVRKQGKRENSDGSIDYFVECYCPHCGKLLNRGFDIPWAEFCYKCGKAVKWE